jgi:8-hydroxy-5-deazaflavin:NADPH oxidoreductase
MKIAILGAGNVGRRLNTLMTSSGEHSVALCSRNVEDGLSSFQQGVGNADVVFLAVPYTALSEMLAPLEEVLQGKIVVDCTNPLQPDWAPLLLGEENSGGEEVSRMLRNSKVVKAFNTIFADVMVTERQVRAGTRVTAFVASDDSDAANTVMQLGRDAGFSPLYVGPLRMARHLEAMAHLNIQIAVAMGGGTNAAFIYHQ